MRRSRTDKKARGEHFFCARPVFVFRGNYLCSAPLLEQALLDVPELLAQVHIVVVGVLKPLDLVPEGVDLSGAPGPHLLDAGLLVDQPAALEDGDQELPDGEVGDGLALPGGLGVEELQGLGQ